LYFIICTAQCVKNGIPAFGKPKALYVSEKFGKNSVGLLANYFSMNEFKNKNGYENKDWIPMIQDMVQWREVLKSNEPSGSIKRGNILDQLSD
jgi:hypothetical protein